MQQNCIRPGLWELTKLPRLPNRLRIGTPPPHSCRRLRPLDLGAFSSLLLIPLPQYKFTATPLHDTHPV